MTIANFRRRLINAAVYLGKILGREYVVVYAAKHQICRVHKPIDASAPSYVLVKLYSGTIMPMPLTGSTVFAYRTL